MSHTALKLAAALLVILGLAGAALVASRLIRPAEAGSFHQPIVVGRMDALHGWAWDNDNEVRTSGDQVTFMRQTGRLLLTDDEGKSWRVAGLPPIVDLATFAYPQIQFVDAGHGWLMPAADITYPDPGFLAMNKLWRTSDGGRSWQSTDLPAGAIARGFMSYVSVDTGFLLLAPRVSLASNWVLYRTGDGGATWSQVAAVPLPDGFQGDSGWPRPQTLVFSDASNGFLILGYEGQTVLQTHDGGVTWSPIELPKPTDPTAVLLRVTELRTFGSEVVMTAVLGQQGDGGTFTDPVASNYPVYTSDDAGRTWQATYSLEAAGIPVDDGMWSIVDPQTWVYVYGQTVACTRDGGATWSKRTGSGLPGGSSPFYPVFVSPNDGWGVVLILGSGTTVAMTHDGGATWDVVPKAKATSARSTVVPAPS